MGSYEVSRAFQIYISPQKQNPVKYDIPPTSALGWLYCSSGEK